MARSQSRHHDRSHPSDHWIKQDRSRPRDTFHGKGSRQKACHVAY